MIWQEKEEVMLMFQKKMFDVLVSTTVIKVGIDIPDANIILINDAHRFGLSQLHQLRGRVGRGLKQAYCILVTSDRYAVSGNNLFAETEYLSPSQVERYKSGIRLKTMVDHLDGFKIAEVDMKLRGPGDIFSKQQSGFPEFRYVNWAEDTDLLLSAKAAAFRIIADDPNFKQERNIVIKKILKKDYSGYL